MAAYKVKITFDPRKVTAPVAEPFANICTTFQPDTAYVDSEDYNGTRYDSNVRGFGSIPQVEPYASTSIPMGTPLAQFKLARLAQVVNAETGVRELTFEVDDYKEAFYYAELADDLKDQGFAVEVAGLGPQPASGGAEVHAATE